MRTFHHPIIHCISYNIFVKLLLYSILSGSSNLLTQRLHCQAKLYHVWPWTTLRLSWWLMVASSRYDTELPSMETISIFRRQLPHSRPIVLRLGWKFLRFSPEIINNFPDAKTPGKTKQSFHSFYFVMKGLVTRIYRPLW